jgi:4-amino-4-deoxy-L-arabinose transferase-like glycosyltransferase
MALIRSLKDLRYEWGDRRRRGPWLRAILLLCCLPVFFLGLGSPGLYDPHESRNAEAAREMLVSGDWLTPHLDFARYLDKPPLGYWLIGLSYVAFGVSEFSARLPIALASLGGVLTTWLIGRDLFGEKVGFLAALVLLSSIGYFIFSRQVLPDPIFSCFTTFSFFCFLRSFGKSRHQRLYGLLLYISLALAVLTKGLLGLFPLFVIGLYLLCIGRLHYFRDMTTVWGTMLFFILAIPWHLSMAWQHTGFFSYYFINEQFLRFLGRRDPIDYTTLPLPVFLAILLLWLVPWSAYLPLAVHTHLQRGRNNFGRRQHGGLLILLWAGAILGFFSLSQARLHQYLLPAMPAFALLIGKSLVDRMSEKITSSRVPILLSVMAVLLLALGCAFVPAYLARVDSMQLPGQIPALASPFFITILAASVLAALASSRRFWVFSLLGLMCSMVVVFSIAHHGLILVEPMQSSKPLAELIERDRQPGEKIVLEVEEDGPFEYAQVAGLAFYTGQKIHLLRRKNPPKPPLPWTPEEQFVLSEAEFHRLWEAEDRVYLVTDAYPDRTEVLDGRATIVMLGQVGNRYVLSNQASSTSSGRGSILDLPAQAATGR